MRLAEIKAAYSGEVIEDLTRATPELLRRRRSELQDVEAQVSLARRVIQGRLDLIGSLRAVRGEGVTDTDAQMAAVLASLPELIGRDLGSGGSRPPAQRGIVAPDEELIDELDEYPGADVVGLIDGSDADLDRAFEQLGAIEFEISELRRHLHTQLDRIQAEIVERYRASLSR